jgi:hypothetical protein
VRILFPEQKIGKFALKTPRIYKLIRNLEATQSLSGIISGGVFDAVVVLKDLTAKIPVS